VRLIFFDFYLLTENYITQSEYVSGSQGLGGA